MTNGVTAASEPLAVVQGVLADFGRGDIASLVGRVDDSVVWRTPFPTDVLPHGGTKRGKAGVQQFFAQLAEEVAWTHFEVRELIAGAERVVVLGSYAGTSRLTGKPFAEDFAFVFTVRNGAVVAMDEYSDPTAMARAATPDR